mgnify:CR=1 FL=1
MSLSCTVPRVVTMYRQKEENRQILVLRTKLDAPAEPTIPLLLIPGALQEGALAKPVEDALDMLFRAVVKRGPPMRLDVHYLRVQH